MPSSRSGRIHWELGVGGVKSGLEAMSGVFVVLDWKSGGAEATFCVSTFGKIAKFDGK